MAAALYKGARAYLNRAVKDEVEVRAYNWTPAQRKATADYIWFTEDRRLWSNALATSATVAPPLPAAWLPAVAITAAQARLAERNFKAFYDDRGLPTARINALNAQVINLTGANTTRQNRINTLQTQTNADATRIQNLEDSRRENEQAITRLKNQLRDGTVVDPTATSDPDPYPFYFWPDMPWDEDPDTSTWVELVQWYSARPRKRPASGEWPEWNARVREWLKIKPQMFDVDDNDWRGIHFLGIGGYGSVGLYVQVNEEHNIQDRMVVKEAVPLRHQWNNPINWRNGLFREIEMHRRVEKHRAHGDAAHKHLIHMKGWRLMMRKRRYRLYLDVCSAGSLKSAMSNTLFDNWRRVDEGQAGGDPSRRLPEEYVLYVFSALVDACLVLQRGRAEASQDGWRPIVHCDLKPNNVFLDSSGAGEKSWPRPVLGDFGAAFDSLAHEDNPPDVNDNPKEYVWSSSSTMYPPDQQPDNVSERISEKTAVWGIGSIMWTLVTNRNVRGPGPVRETQQTINDSGGRTYLDTVTSRNPRSTEDILNGKFFNAPRYYPSEMKDLIRQCLEHNQADRPTLDQLRQWIDDRYHNNPLLRTDRPPVFLGDTDPFQQYTRGRTVPHPG